MFSLLREQNKIEERRLRSTSSRGRHRPEPAMSRQQTVAEVLCGSKTGRRYEPERCRGVLADRVSLSCQVSISAQPRRKPLPERLRALLAVCFYPHESPKSPLT